MPVLAPRRTHELPCLSFPSRLERAPLPGAIDAGGTLRGKRVVTSEELPQIGGSPMTGYACDGFQPLTTSKFMNSVAG